MFILLTKVFGIIRDMFVRKMSLFSMFEVEHESRAEHNVKFSCRNLTVRKLKFAVEWGGVKITCSEIRKIILDYF